MEQPVGSREICNALIALCSLAACAYGETTTVYRFKDARTLGVQSDVVALRGGLALPRTAGVNEVPDSSVNAHADWRLAERGTLRNEESVRDLCRRLVEEGLCDFAAPVLDSREIEGARVIPTQEILIGVAPEVDDLLLRMMLEEAGLNGDEAIDSMGAFPSLRRVTTRLRTGFDVLDAAADLAVRPGIRFAEPAMIFEGRSAFTPNDTSYGIQWGLHNTGQSGGTANIDIDAPAAWDTTMGSSLVKVVIIETGVQRDHPDLVVADGIDVTDDGPGDGSPVNEWDIHGTPVAGIIGATMHNNLGVAGAAPDVQILSARTFITINSDGNWSSGTLETLNTLAWAVAENARVTNNSNIYGFQSSAIDTAYADSKSGNQIVHFASSGNDSLTNVAYPASIPSVHAIGAIDRTGEIASFSNIGPSQMFAGPGVTVLSTDRTDGDGYSSGDYISFGGTSAASPMMAGVAALIISADPTLVASEVDQLMIDARKDLGDSGWDETFGWGLVSTSFAIGLLDEGPGSCPVDIVDDGIVDGGDLALLLAQWGPLPGAESDLNGDDVVDGADLALLLAVWGPC